MKDSDYIKTQIELTIKQGYVNIFHIDKNHSKPVRNISIGPILYKTED